MAFGISAHLASMRAPASKAVVAHELTKLLAILGEAEPCLVAELNSASVTQSVLAELVLWNARLAPSTQRDRLGHAAIKFFAAQTLATTVMRSKALDPLAGYSIALKRAMTCGADGLFVVGQSQFEVLAKTANDLVAWIAEHQLWPFAIIESPLGNSLPVQVVCDLARRREIDVVPVEWNAPRNDRPARGRTISEASRACADATAQVKLVVLMDDAITGSRFVKLFDALVHQIGYERFLPVVMRFEDTSRPETANNPNWGRLTRRVEQQAGRIGYSTPVVDFPLLRLFQIDSGPPAKWVSPIIWGDSDLIAGKRKVNLIFTLIDHCFGILEDLGAKESTFRTYLERAWQQDTTGAMFQFAPGVVCSVFRGIIDELPLEDLHLILWDKAKERFPQDYKGNPFALHEEGTKERWNWFQEAFLAVAAERLDEQRAAVAWRAIEDTFAASFPEYTPRPARDQDATPYTFPFNPTIAALNFHLREKICALAK